jgi:DNA-binding MarR family transcriptional regulator
MNATTTAAKESTPQESTHDDARLRAVFLLARLGRIASRRLSDYLAVTGLKRPHAVILMELRNFGPISQQSLGERLHIDPSNLVTFLNALEDEGLLVRRRDPEDRRRHIVELTQEGLGRVPVCDEPLDALEDQLFAGLGAKDRERLRRLLDRVLVTMSIEEPPPGENGEID